MTDTVRTIYANTAANDSRDFIVIRRSPAGVSIEAQGQEGGGWESATAGQFDAAAIRAALDEVAPAGSYTRHEHTDRNADGDRYCPAERDYFACSREDGHPGPHVAATRDVQNSICEVWAERHEAHDAAHNIDWQAVAEQHEDTIQALIAERDEADARAKGYAATIDEQRALITDLRAAQPRPLTADDITDEMVERARKAWNRSAALGNDLWRDVLTAAIVPTRPEGAEELARLIRDADVGEWDCGDLADALLATGRVRVVTEEQS